MTENASSRRGEREDGQRARAGRRWTRLVPGAVLVAGPLAIAATTWGALIANHPAYPLSLALAFVVGLCLLITGWRRQPLARGGPVRTLFRVLAAAAGVGIAAVLVWLAPFVASDAALVSLNSESGVTVTDSRTATVYEPAGEPAAGLVLFGGARVDPRAYAVLAQQIAAEGYQVVVVKCPFDLELLCPDAASTYVDASMPWAVGGHSLGGVAASSYALGQPEVDGLVLWASFPVSDLSGRADLAVTSITGSEDGFTTPTKVSDRAGLLPASTVFVEISGGIHAFFGDYGDQPGDGTPTVTREVAQQQIVDATVELLEGISSSPQ